MSLYSLDIETLGTPENSGYSVVIPNYAVVKVPDELTHKLDWLYVQLPIQDQLDIGLKTDARTMDFWFNICAQEFPLALCEMQKSFTLQRAKVFEYSPRTKNSGLLHESTHVTTLLKNFIGKPDSSTKVFGNGCHFDCSILQENHRVLYGDGELWHYSSPNNVRTLRLLMNEEDELAMKEAVQPHLDLFVESVNELDVMYGLCLHNPVYDAAKEALFTSYIMKMKKST